MTTPDATTPDVRRHAPLEQPRATQVRRAAIPLVLTLLLLTGLMLGIGELLTHHAGAVGRLDVRIERSLAAHRSGTLNTATKYGTYLAETVPVIVLAVLAVAVAVIRTRRWRPPLTIALAVIGEKVVYLIVGTVVTRQRPPVPRLGAADPSASFPSGHTGSAVTLYSSIALVLLASRARPVWRAIAVVLAVLAPIVVAFCRMDRGFHHLTDVVAGGVIGLVWLLVVNWAVLRPYRDRVRRDAVAADWLHAEHGSRADDAAPETGHAAAPDPGAGGRGHARA